MQMSMSKKVIPRGSMNTQERVTGLFKEWHVRRQVESESGERKVSLVVMSSNKAEESRYMNERRSAASGPGNIRVHR
jgi:hypothetical protein